MIYFPTRGACPNRAKLDGMTAEQACDWAAGMDLAPGILTHAMEVSRMAEVETFFSLTRRDADRLHGEAVQRVYIHYKAV